MAMTYLICKKCGWEREVSEVDPDSTLSDGMEHLLHRHPGANPGTNLDVVMDSKSPDGLL